MIDLGCKVCVFGINVYTDEVISNFDVQYIIDDFVEMDLYKGISIKKSTDIENSEVIINCAGGKILTTQKLLKQYSDQVIHYAELQKHYPKNFRDLVFNEKFSEIYSNNKQRYDNTLSILEDSKSKEIYSKLTNFRLTQRIDFLDGFEDLQDQQYFEPFLNKAEGAVFYDIGCYDGKTTDDFINWNVHKASVIFFEPFEQNFYNCQTRFEKNINVKGLKAAVSNSTRTSKIVGIDDTAKIDDDGEIDTFLIKLDDMVPEKLIPPTFIKIDIEGGEMDALKGMENTLRTYTPQIAISIYHRPADFFEIPEFILGISNNYKLYLRHYTESIYETVMFFVPQSL